MNRVIFAVVVLLFTSWPAYAVEIEQHERTSVPANCRFELIQSTLAAKLTIRVDKFTGRVDQIVEAIAGGKTWQAIPRRKHPLDKVTPNEVNYQVFTSGLAMKFTFMININTGATWQLIEFKDGLVWDPIL